MVEIEIGVLKSHCLDRRIDGEKLKREVAAWQRERNAAGAGVTWVHDRRPAPKWVAPTRWAVEQRVGFPAVVQQEGQVDESKRKGQVVGEDRRARVGGIALDPSEILPELRLSSP
jgi:hypothetical protein